MLKKSLLSTASWAVVLSALGSIDGAEASTFSVMQTLSPGANLTQSGGSYVGQFNLNGLLPGGTTIGDVDAVAAHITAYGYSPAAPTTSDQYSGYQLANTVLSHTVAQAYTYYYTYYYSCGWFSTCSGTGSATGYYYYNVYDYYYLQDHIRHVDDPVDDTMLLTVGGQSVQDDTDLVNQSNTYNGTTYTGGYNGGYYQNSYIYQQRDYVDTNELYGPLQVDLTLDALNLADLDGDGILSFQIDAALGQFSFDSIVITADFETVGAGGTGTAIAESGTAGIMGSSLAILLAGVMYRRRRFATTR